MWLLKIDNLSTVLQHIALGLLALGGCVLASLLHYGVWYNNMQFYSIATPGLLLHL